VWSLSQGIRGFKYDCLLSSKRLQSNFCYAIDVIRFRKLFSSLSLMLLFCAIPFSLAQSELFKDQAVALGIAEWLETTPDELTFEKLNNVTSKVLPI
jgi:hypothetical protein